MTVTQSHQRDEDILGFVDQSVRQLQEQGLEPRFLVLGPDAYEALCQAMARRFNRSAGHFESYQWLTVVVDPFRTDEVCVLPNPGALTDGAQGIEL